MPRPQAALTVPATPARGQNSETGSPLITGTTYMATSDGAMAPTTIQASQ